MKTTLISGTFFDVSYHTLMEVFAKILDKKKLRLKIRVVGEEINYEDDLHEIYIFSLNDSKDGIKDDYHIDSEYKGDLENTTAFLNQLIDILKKEKMIYRFEYNEQEGDIEGEEYQLYHPDLL